MSTPAASDRPMQVTIGALGAATSALLLVAGAFDGVTGLRSLATREELHRMVDSASGRRINLTLAQATGTFHVLLVVAGGAAAVALVLAVASLLGQRPARVGLAIAAIVALIGSLAADPLLGLFLVGGTALLWTDPARRWYDGLPQLPKAPRPDRLDGPRTPAERDGREQHDSASAPPAGPPIPSGSPTAPPPTIGFGGYATPAAGPDRAPVSAPVPAPPQTYVAPPAAAAARRDQGAPATVRLAAVLTWIFTGLAGLSAVATAVLLFSENARTVGRIADRPDYRDLGWSTATYSVVIGVGLAVLAAWALAAALLALFAWRGHAWARVLLMVSGLIAACLCLLAMPVAIPHLVVCLVVCGLLLSPSAASYFGDRQDPHSGGKPPTW